jgi:hypothetical protein
MVEFLGLTAPEWCVFRFCLHIVNKNLCVFYFLLCLIFVDTCAHTLLLEVNFDFQLVSEQAHSVERIYFLSVILISL